MTDHLPYIPDVDRLLKTLQKMGGSRPEDWEGDIYAFFWTEVNLPTWTLGGPGFLCNADGDYGRVMPELRGKIVQKKCFPGTTATSILFRTFV